jgi:hypothetical protein
VLARSIRARFRLRSGGQPYGWTVPGKMLMMGYGVPAAFTGLLGSNWIGFMKAFAVT